MLIVEYTPKPQLQTSSSSQDGNVFRSKDQQTSLTGTVHAWPLKWNPPSTRTSWNKWGSTARDFARLFSFWSKWTTQPAEAAIPVRTWTQALAFFVQNGGSCADFLYAGQFVGMRLISSKSFRRIFLRLRRTLMILMMSLKHLSLKQNGLKRSLLKLLSPQVCFSWGSN